MGLYLLVNVMGEIPAKILAFYGPISGRHLCSAFSLILIFIYNVHMKFERSTKVLGLIEQLTTN